MKKILIGLACFFIFANSCFADTVSFNVNSHKFHNLKCRYADCKNCIKIERQQAIKRGGISCKICGG